MSPRVFLTFAEVAERWGCGVKVVRAAVDRDELRAHRFSRKVVRVALDELERYERRLGGARSRDRHAEGEGHGGTS